MSCLPDAALCTALQRAPAVLFDLFRTLTSVEATNVPRLPEAAPMLGLDQEPLAGAWQAAWEATAEDRVLGRITQAYDVLAIPARRANPALPDSLLDAAVAVRQAKFDNALQRIAPEVLAALAALRRGGKRLALVSNADRMDIAGWPGSPLAACFDAVIFSCDIGAAKPDAAIYLAACQALGVSPVGCLFVGDGGSDELCGAAAVGMAPVQMTGILDRYFPGLTEAQAACAQYRIRDIAALSACLA